MIIVYPVLAVTIGVALNPDSDFPKPPVVAAAFAPEGKSVVIGSQNGLDVLSWPALESLRPLTTSLVNIHDLAFSPDGKTLVAAGGTPAEEGICELIAWPAGTLTGRIAEHDDIIYCVAWSPDGRRLATASADRTCRVYDAESGNLQCVLEGHSRPVLAIEFLSDDTVVSAGVDHSLRVWDAKAGRLLRSLDNHRGPVSALAARPSDEVAPRPMIASIGADRTVRFWQPTIGRLVRFAQIESEPFDVAWTANGQRVLVSCRDGKLRVIDPESTEMVAEHEAVSGWAYTLAVAPDGSALVGGTAGQLRRIEIASVSENTTHSASNDGGSTLFSGPQAGERLPPLAVSGVYEPHRGRQFDLVGMAGGKAVLWIFVHQSSRPAAALTRALVNYAEMRKVDRLFAAEIHLTDDPSTTEQNLRRAVSWWGAGVPVVVGLDGAEGPGSYGLNRKVGLTILVGTAGRVTANFALVQPAVSDAEKVLQEVVDLVGGNVPTRAELEYLKMPTRRPEGARWRRGTADPQLRAFLCEAIAATDNPASLAEAIDSVNRHVGSDSHRQRELAESADLLLSLRGGSSVWREQLQAWTKRRNAKRQPCE